METKYRETLWIDFTCFNKLKSFEDYNLSSQESLNTYLKYLQKIDLLRKSNIEKEREDGNFLLLEWLKDENLCSHSYLSHFPSRFPIKEWKRIYCLLLENKIPTKQIPTWLKENCEDDFLQTFRPRTYQNSNEKADALSTFRQIVYGLEVQIKRLKELASKDIEFIVGEDFKDEEV